MIDRPPLELAVLLLAALAVAGFSLWRLQRGQGAPRGLWETFEEGIGLFLLIAMVAASLLQVFARYALGNVITLPWTEELSRLLLVWTAFWGAAILQRGDDHIAMSLVYDQLNARGKLLLRLFGDLVCFLVLAVIVWQSWQPLQVMETMSSTSLGISMLAFLLPVPLTGALMLLFTARLAWRRMHALRIAGSSGS